MASYKDIILTITGRDETGSALGNVRNNIQKMSSNFRSAVNEISSNFGDLNTAVTGAFSAITGKSIYDEVFGTTNKAETNKVLINNMTSTKAAAENLYSTVDNVTNNSLTSMQELIPALNQLKAATGANDQEITNVAEGVANFGAYVQAMTGSTELAQTAMGDLSKGAKGAYASLDQYGITEDSLKRTGLWSGEEKDIEGYIAAVTKVIGSTDALMNTNAGLDAQINKAFSRGGKQIGNFFLPYIEQAKRGFLNLDNATDGWITKLTMIGGGALSGLQVALTTIGQVANGIKSIMDAVDFLKNTIHGVEQITESETQIAALNAKAAAYEELAAAATHAAEAEKMEAVSAVDLPGGIQKKSTTNITGKDINAAASHAGAGINPNAMGAYTDDMEKIAVESTTLTTVGEEAAVGAAGAEASALSLSALSASISAMLAPLLSLSAVIAIMIPIAAGLVAEGLVFIKGIQILFDKLDFGGIDLTSGINGLKQIGSALWALAGALAGMSLTFVLSWVNTLLDPLGLGMQQVASSINKIKQAIPMINSFASSENINKQAIEKLKAVCEGLKSVSEAVKALSSTSGVISWENFLQFFRGGMLENLQKARGKIIAAVPVINSFASMPSTNKQATQKLKDAAEGLKSASEAVKALSQISGDIHWDIIWQKLNGGMIENLQKAKNKLWQAANVLATFKDMPAIPTGTGNKIQRVTWTINNVSNAMKSLKSPNIQVDPGMISKITLAVNVIRQVATQLRSLINISAIPTGTGNKIQRISWSANSVSNAIRTFRSMPTVDSNYINKVKKAVTTIRSAAIELRKLSSVNVGNVSKATNGIKNALNQINTILSSMKSTVYTPSVGIGQQIANGIMNGLKSLPSLMSGGILQACSTAASSGWTGGSKIGDSTTRGFKSALKIADAINTEMDYAIQAINNKKSALVSAATQAASEAADAFKNKGLQQQSPGLMARASGQEMIFAAQMLRDKSTNLVGAATNAGQSASRGFKPSFGVNMNNIHSLQQHTAGTPSNLKSNNKENIVYNIHIGKQEFPLSNLTTEQCKQVVNLAIKGGSTIKN